MGVVLALEPKGLLVFLSAGSVSRTSLETAPDCHRADISSFLHYTLKLGSSQ